MNFKQIATVGSAHMGEKIKDKRGRSTGHDGVCITFITNEVIQNRTKLAITDYLSHYFEVHSIEINEDKKFEVEAHEVGYFAKRFDRQADFDMRVLLDKGVVVILDQETKNKIQEESCWC